MERQREARENLNFLSRRAEQVVVIHYSCESFYKTEGGRTPRISSIACRRFKSAQTRSFSIHQYSELPEFSTFNIQENYEDIERKLLREFFSYVEGCIESTYWLHWNMRDINFGFTALEHRFRVLGGNPSIISDDRKFDLARILVSCYGKKYAGHPRLESITQRNRITDRDMLPGKDEAYAFKDGEFTQLYQSTLRKVDVISNIAERAIDGSLVTDAPFWDQHGGSLRLVWEKYVGTPIGLTFSGLSALLVVVGVTELFYPEIRARVSSYFYKVLIEDASPSD